MTDNIESSSKGILHMAISDRVQQIAYSSGTLSYHECYLSQINFTGQYSYIPPPVNNSIYGADSPSLRDVMSRKGANDSQAKRGQSLQAKHQAPMTYITNNKSKKII